MGLKRSFEDEELHEFPLKHSRQLYYGNKITQFDEVVPYHIDPQKPAVAVEDERDLCKSQGIESSEDETFYGHSKCVGTDSDNIVPFSWATKSSSEEDTTHSTLSQEYFELDLPCRMFAPVEETYSFLSDRSPRKQVPLGPEHQANIPLWRRDSKDEKLDRFHTSLLNHSVENDGEEKLMGTCIISMPDSSISAFEDCKVGEGRRDCICLDRGSLRCVSQHIKEVREELIKTIGYAKFAEVGFCEMGEEVAHKWTEEEEHLFHEVVYSNPASLGQNFWKHLASAFPSRTKKEIVSYYFNVFILRRRAIQNRSRLLDIDSDDDEWHGSYGGYFGIQCLEEDEDSAIESPFHRDIDTGHGRVCTVQGEDDDDDDSDNDDDDDDSDNDDDDDDGCGDNALSGNDVSFSDNAGLNSTVHCSNKVSGSSGEELNVQDDSCMSFELQHNVVDSHGHIANQTFINASKEKTELGDYQQNKLGGCNHPVNQTFLFEPCDAKVWDARFSTVPSKGADLLPTRSIIEEIFGQGTWDNKTRNE